MFSSQKKRTPTSNTVFNNQKKDLFVEPALKFAKPNLDNKEEVPSNSGLMNNLFLSSHVDLSEVFPEDPYQWFKQKKSEAQAYVYKKIRELILRMVIKILGNTLNAVSEKKKEIEAKIESVKDQIKEVIDNVINALDDPKGGVMFVGSKKGIAEPRKHKSGKHLDYVDGEVIETVGSIYGPNINSRIMEGAKIISDIIQTVVEPKTDTVKVVKKSNEDHYVKDSFENGVNTITLINRRGIKITSLTPVSEAQSIKDSVRASKNGYEVKINRSNDK